MIKLRTEQFRLGRNDWLERTGEDDRQGEGAAQRMAQAGAKQRARVNEDRDIEGKTKPVRSLKTAKAFGVRGQR